MSTTFVTHGMSTMTSPHGIEEVCQESGINVYVEISYSSSRLEEMRNIGEKNCTLLISVLKHHLEKRGIKNITSWIPQNKDRYTDIVLEYAVPDMASLEKSIEILKQIGGSSVGKIEVFIDA